MLLLANIELTQICQIQLQGEVLKQFDRFSSSSIHLNEIMEFTDPYLQ